MELKEDILCDSLSKYVFKVVHEDLNEFYKLHVSTFWTPEEIDFQQDLSDWNKLTSQEQFFLKHVLAFFAASDGIVNENLAENFLTEVKYPEARAFYTFQMAMETIHSETYRILIETYISDETEKQQLFDAISTFPAIKSKAEWALRWTNKETASFAERVIAFAAVEGIFFSGSFCAIFWLKKRGLMPGLAFSNELIAKDEGLHCEFAINLYNKHIQNKLKCERIKDILMSALEIEKQFILESLPAKLIGMNSNLMSQYLEFITDRLLTQLGCQKVFNVLNPFDFMEIISIEGTTNFFEKRNSDYKKASVLEKRVALENLTFDENF